MNRSLRMSELRPFWCAVVSFAAFLTTVAIPGSGANPPSAEGKGRLVTPLDIHYTRHLQLDAVEDDTRLTHADSAAYYGLLDITRQFTNAQMISDGKEFVRSRQTQSGLPTFVDMLRHPNEFRGQPVFLAGHVQQTLEYDAGENPYGIEKLYETWLYTDGSQTHPTVIVFLEKPAILPIGGEMVDGIRVAGFFLKTYLYPSQDNHTRRVPLILARSVTVSSPPIFGQPVFSFGVGIGVALVGFGVLVGFTWWGHHADRTRQLRRRDEQLPETPDFSQVSGEPDVSGPDHAIGTPPA